jgi:hypothetical protein
VLMLWLKSYGGAKLAWLRTFKVAPPEEPELLARGSVSPHVQHSLCSLISAGAIAT